jgi:hypothetical protein
LGGAQDYNLRSSGIPLSGIPLERPCGLCYTTCRGSLKDLRGGSKHSNSIGSHKSIFVLVNMSASPAPDIDDVLHPFLSAVDESSEQSYSKSHLVRGVLFARVGLLDDAERELRALAAANPRSAVARKLLASVTALRKKV